MKQRALFSFCPGLLLVCLIAFLLSSCAPATTQYTGSTSDENLLRVGVTTNAPPLIYKKNRKITGLEVDFAKKFAKFTGKKAKFIEVEWSDQIDALEKNKIDIVMSGMSITPARKYRATFSNPYLLSGQILLVRLKDKARFSTGIYSLMNSPYTIGVVKNTTGDLFITETINRVKIERFPSADAAVTALINKKIDVFVYDAPMVCHYAAINENSKLAPILTLTTEEYLAWAMRKEDSELQLQANQFLRQLERSGQLQQMIRNWIPYM